ncbi:PAS domain S-box protein [Bradyrhizobium sp. SZCCHNR2026]|uniref:PAS domain S-box protein n=1 Tax=Bradyrhizobium sp. SZCCHNR2026 TaxID=3057381 RepID=UPI002915D572|nr:PAS domain S-box protein [Bradyrhizobium sp. SZCCHNR2026]
MNLFTGFPLRLTIPTFLFLLALSAETLTMKHTQEVADAEEEKEALALVTQDMSQLQASIDNSLRKGDWEGVQSAIALRGSNPNVAVLVLVDDAGTIVGSTSLKLIGVPIGRALPNVDAAFSRDIGATLNARVSLSDDRQFISAYYPVILGAKEGEIRPNRVGLVYLRYDLTYAKGIRRYELGRQALVVTGFYGGGFLLLVVFLHLVLTKRVGQLVSASTRFAAGDLAARTGFVGKDELAQIGAGFDRMAKEIAKNHEALVLLNRDLRRSEKFLDDIVENVPNMIFIKDAQTLRFLRINKAGEQLLGCSREELLGKNDYDFFPKQEADFFTSKDREVLGKKGPVDIPEETIKSRGQGDRIILHTKKISIEGNEGKPQYLLGISEDITERKKAELRMAQLAAQNRLILDSVGEGVCGLDSDGRCAFVNPAASQLLGFTIEELVGQDGHSKFHHTRADGRPYLEEECPVHSAFKRGMVTRGTELFWRKDGSSFRAEFISTPILDAGKVTGAVVTFRDITERERIEQRNAQLAAIVESSDDAIFGKTLEGVITSWNKGAELIYGYTAQEVVGRSVSVLMPPGRRQEMSSNLALIREGRHILHFETPRRKKDGKEIYVSLTMSPVKDDAGHIIGASAIERDVTELKQAEEELRKERQHLEEVVAMRTAELTTANDDLEATNRELEAFAYSVSHDLRVPLRAIDGFSRILLEDYSGKLDAEGQRVLNVVRDNAIKMARLIDDILAFSRAGRSEIAPARIDMDGAVRAVIEELAPAVAGRRLTFDIKPLAPAQGDPAMVRRVWTNLIDNAIKFTAPKPDAVIEIGSTAGKDETTYYVKDNGAGFDMQYAAKLFGVFQRLHGSEFAGTGIGLAIVKRIVVRHGGQVWAEGRVNEGATFYFTLPVREDSHA